MKLSDIDKINKLSDERDYLRNLKLLAAPVPGLRFGRYEVRPDLVERMIPAIKAVLDAGIARVDADLFSLGVTVEGEPV